MADLQLRILGEDAASSAFASVSSAARSAQQVLVDFARASVRSYMEAERSQRQLAVVAKEMTGAFQAQASALAQANAVSGELVESIQTLLLRYGAAPKDVEATTQAVLDFAAATGTDARAAAEALTRGVETGTGSLKAMGVTFDATGKRSEDLRRAADALGKKFGGAGAADAASLAGQVRLAEDAFDDVRKAFGGFITDTAEKSGALSKINSLLKTFGESLREAQFFVKAGGLGALKDAALSFLPGAQDGDMRSAKIGLEQARARAVDMMLAEREAQRAAEEALKRRDNPDTGQRDRVTGPGRGGGSTGVMDMSRFEIDLTPEGPEAPSGAQWMQMRREAFADAARAAKLSTRAGDEAERFAQEQADAMAKAADAALAVARQRQAEFAQVGAALGSAFASSLSGAVEALAAGEQLDLGQTVGDILAGLLPLIGSIAGTALGGPAGSAFGGAIGTLLGAGARGLGRAGGGVTVNTMDAQSAREFFEGGGGRAIENAMRTGRGSLGRW
jgi:hypothetical protein